MSKNNFSFFAILNWALTFWVDGVAMEIPIPDPGSTDKTLYCEKQQSRSEQIQTNARETHVQEEQTRANVRKVLNIWC